jgi:hypothetical protein
LIGDAICGLPVFRRSLDVQGESFGQLVIRMDRRLRLQHPHQVNDRLARGGSIKVIKHGPPEFLETHGPYVLTRQNLPIVSIRDVVEDQGGRAPLHQGKAKLPCLASLQGQNRISKPRRWLAGVLTKQLKEQGGVPQVVPESGNKVLLAAPRIRLRGKDD